MANKKQKRVCISGFAFLRHDLFFSQIRPDCEQSHTGLSHSSHNVESPVVCALRITFTSLFLMFCASVNSIYMPRPTFLISTLLDLGDDAAKRIAGKGRDRSILCMDPRKLLLISFLHTYIGRLRNRTLQFRLYIVKYLLSPTLKKKAIRKNAVRTTT